MNYKLVITCFALTLATTLSAKGQVKYTTAVKVLTPTAKWTGKVANSALLSAVPTGGFITDAQTFANLCTKWAPGTTIPTVDFTKEMVLVATATGPNRVGLKAIQDKNGNVTMITPATKIGGGGFGYHIVTVSRGNAKKVNGVIIPKGQNNQNNQVGTVGKQQDYVTVTVRGDLTTGLVAILPKKTTGITITASGATYELDFGTNVSLKAQVDKLNGRKVLMKGNLTVNPVSKRSIVTVKSIYLTK